MSADARTTILARVRAPLEAARALLTSVEPEARPTWTDPSWAQDVDAAARANAFRARLEAVDGHVWQPADRAGVAEVLTQILNRAAPQSIAVSDAAAVRELVHGYTRTHAGIGVVPWSAGRAALAEADVGVTLAQHGIAETGTLVLDSSVECHRLVSLLPAVHIALLPVAAILGTLGDALASVRDESGAVRGRAITFITGPSRTADIELTLVVGVHGPRELHVILTPENAL